ncbi:MAG TPA: hypothetical protein PKX83_08755 [Bacteroidales bacterium]|jgi:uncharacterized membrane protein|nr:hypothetical protein [Bacteroidales bacterium]
MEVGFFLLLSLLVWVIYRSYHSPVFAFFSGLIALIIFSIIDTDILLSLGITMVVALIIKSIQLLIKRIGCGGVSQGEKDQKKAGDESTKEQFGYISRHWS